MSRNGIQNSELRTQNLDSTPKSVRVLSSQFCVLGSGRYWFGFFGLFGSSGRLSLSGVFGSPEPRKRRPQNPRFFFFSGVAVVGGTVSGFAAVVAAGGGTGPTAAASRCGGGGNSPVETMPTAVLVW